LSLSVSVHKIVLKLYW